MNTNQTTYLHNNINKPSITQSLLRLGLLLFLLPLAIMTFAFSYYYTDFKATGGATGKGYVYAGTTNTATPAYVETSDDIDASEPGSGKPTTYYAWAKAVRGADFSGWTLSSATLSTNNSGIADVITVTAPTSNGTTTGVATAKWTTYSKVNVTYNPSEDGIYTITYQYNTYNSADKTITSGDAEDLSRTITSKGGAQTIGSYKNDIITLKSTSGTFQGWYSDAGFSSLLSTANPYTYTAPTSGSAAVYPKYEHVDKYYGRLTASIAAVPYSMPGGGTIFISKEEAGTGTYSADAQTVDNVGMGTTGLKYYLHAQPTDKRYVFRGWYSNPECTGAALSTNADYTYTFTSSSTNSASPTLGNVYAAFDFNLYYMQVEVEPAVPGLGMVLVKDNNTGTPEYTDYTTHAEQFLYAYRLTPTANAYLYAKPKYGYKFSGWYDNPDCTGTAKSTANPYTYAATGTSTDPMNPTIIKLYAKFVEDASTVNITYNLPDQTKGEYTASVLDIAEVDDDFIWTFTQVFTSEGKTGNTTQAQHKTDVLRLEAQPKAGYGVTSWTIAGDAKTTPSQLYETTGTAAATYGVTFGDAKPFLVCATTTATTGTAYATLAEALANLGTNKKIVVVQNAYVPAGNYTIPNGVTLLVPFDEAQTLYTTTPGITKAAPSGQSAYCTLTLGEEANIKVNGEISVSAHQNKGQPYGGAVTGKYGKIELKEGANITLNNGSFLYCWGYITGAGTVDALNGSTVYEDFQITCWRGGSAASSMKSNSKKVFPLAQYAIQNIEAKINFHYGSSEIVYTGVTISYVDPEGNAKIIGTSDCLFQLKSGSVLTRWFDASKDRQMYLLNGDATLGYVKVSISVTVDSRDYVLPLTNNMDITINSGTFTCDYDFAVLPGASITINEGAKVSLGSNCSMYMYDKSEWPEKTTGFNYPSNVAFCKVAYTDTKITTARTYVNMADAKLNVNGILEISKAIYTTAGGADICSSEGTGKIVLKAAAGSETTTYQATQSGTSISYTSIPITAAKLHNGDDSYTLTAGAVANDQFIYSKSQERWLKNPKVVSWNANGGTTEASTMAYSEGDFLGELPAAYKDGYTLEGWYTAASGGTAIGPTTKVTANATYHAHWTPKTFTITYRDQGGAAFSGSHVDSPTPHPTMHIFGTATTLNNATKGGFSFNGWYRTPSCSGTKVTSIAASECKNITLYAKWTETPGVFSVTLNANGGTINSGNITEYTYGTGATLPSDVTKTGYDFGGWFDNSGLTGSAVTTISTTATGNKEYWAKWTAITYTVTLNTNSGVVNEGNITSYTYGTGATLPIDVTKTGYDFGGWFDNSGLTGSAVTTISTTTTGNKEYWAKWTASTYTVTLNTNSGVVNAGNITSYTYGTGATLPINVTKTGYDFGGWFDNSGLTGSAVTTISTTTTGNKEYWAKWTAITYTVTLNANSGTVNAGNITSYTYGTGATLPSDVTKTGYDFGGWFDNSGLTGSAVKTISTSATGNKEYWAKWTASTYTVTLNANSGTVNAGNITSYTYGTGATLPGDVTKTGYDFDGWFDNSSLTGSAVTKISTTATGNKEYWAKWTASTYTVTLNTNSGTVNAGNITSYTYGTGATLPGDVTKTGYDFGGWFDNSDLTGSAVKTISTSATGNKEYWAKWTASTYIVTLNTNSGVVNAGNITSYTYGTGATLPGDVTKTGYDFDGWFDNSSLTGSAVTKISTTATGNKEYWAKWTPITYTISYDLAGGSVTAANPENYTIETATFTLTNPTREGYTFTGWTGTGLASATTTVTITEGSTGNRSYTATWTINNITITWVDGNGVSHVADVTYGTMPTAPDDAKVKAQTEDYSYEFNGWDKAVVAATVATTYTAQFNTVERTYGSEYRLDIVDWSGNTASGTIILNMNGYTLPRAKTNWEVVFGKSEYTKAQRDPETRLLSITGADLSAAGSNLTIKVYDYKEGSTSEYECVSRQHYQVPIVVNSTADLSTLSPAATSDVWVRNGATLTVSGKPTLKTVRVDAGCALKINEGAELTVTDRIVLRTRTHVNVDYHAPELINNGTLDCDKFYYSRIVADKQHLYPIGFPFDVKLSEVTLTNGTATRGTDFAIQYYDGASRAANGVGGNWKLYSKNDEDPKTNILTAKQGFLLLSTSAYYREYLFPMNYESPDATVGVTAYTYPSTSASDAGWNVVVSPFTSTSYITAQNPSQNLKISKLYEDNVNYYQDVARDLEPAVPFYLQIEQTGTLSFAAPSSIVRRRAHAYTSSSNGIDYSDNSVSEQWIRLMFSLTSNSESGLTSNSASGLSKDITNIFLHPTRFSADYETELDVVKLTTSGTKPLVYTSLSCGDLAFAAVPDDMAQAGLPITVNAAQEGIYLFSLEPTDYMSRLDHVYLYDAEQDLLVDLLEDDYIAHTEQGVTRNRFTLRAVFRQPGIATDLDNLNGGLSNGENGGLSNGENGDANANGENGGLFNGDAGANGAQPRKVYHDGYIYIILPNGDVYDTNGKRVEML